jgi:hypothetical protein
MAVGDQFRKIDKNDQLIFDGSNNLVGIQAGNATSPPLRLFNPAKVAALDALVSGDRIPILSWRASSLAASPIAGPISSFGVLSPLTALLIPANTLVAGSSQIRIKFRVLRTGATAAMTPTALFGNVNSIASNAVIDTSCTTACTTIVYTVQIDITSATTFTSFWQVDRIGVGTGINVLNFTTNFNVATDSWVNFGVNPITAPDTVALLSYDVQVFR